MKKTTLLCFVSFLAGALMIAVIPGIVSNNAVNNSPLAPDVAFAESVTPPDHYVKNPYVPLVKKVKPAVVKVVSEAIVETGGSPFGDDFFRDDFFDRFFNRSTPKRKQRVSGVGSGFFVSGDGYILTNYHVVKDAIKIKIIDHRQKEFRAKKIGIDPRTDLALLKIKKSNTPYLELGDSNKVEVGEYVLAIGNPLGQDLTVTSGIISAKGRELRGLEVDYQNFLQTDAPINRGNSGGPLINMDGKAIGINSVIISPSGGNVGIGFAIPSHMARKVISDLKEKGKVTRGYLGIMISDVSESDAKDYDLPQGGVLVAKVEADTAAAKAGLKHYDLIVEVNGNPVKTAMELKSMIANSSPGDTITLKVFRGDKPMTFKIKVEEAPDTEKIRMDNQTSTIDLGMIVRNNSRSFADRQELKTSKGIVVTDVQRGGVADQNGIREGDIILAVNRHQIDDVDDFRRIVSNKKAGSKFLLFIDRLGAQLILHFKIPE